MEHRGEPISEKQRIGNSYILSRNGVLGDRSCLVASLAQHLPMLGSGLGALAVLRATRRKVSFECADGWELQTLLRPPRRLKGTNPLFAATSLTPLRARLRCDCAVTSAVRGRVSDHLGILARLKIQPLRLNRTGLNGQPSGSIPVSATIPHTLTGVE